MFLISLCLFVGVFDYMGFFSLVFLIIWFLLFWCLNVWFLLFGCFDVFDYLVFNVLNPEQNSIILIL